MTAFAALLRAVNVGGRGRVNMAELGAVCEAIGFRGARTLLQSGNVVFEAPRATAATVEKKLAAAIAERFGFETAVMARTAADLAAIVAANPFAEAADKDPSHLVVLFLAAAPDAVAAKRVAALKVGPERVALAGRELFVHYRAGIGTSKLTNAVIETALGGIPATGRNWNTVRKLEALAGTLS